jgi:maltose O-acetyltransferase
MSEVKVRQANLEESNTLTEISFAAKRYWNYPEQYFEVWKSELTITEKYILKNTVYVAEIDEKVVGYFSIVNVPEEFWSGEVFVNSGHWLEHIFIHPDYIGKSIGSTLIDFAKQLCIKNGIEKLYIFSDPNANGFYEKIGAEYIKESPSSIPGRKVSLFMLNVNTNG